MSRPARLSLAVLLALLFGLGLWFRLMRLESIPEVNGDEAFFGRQAFNVAQSRPVELFTPNQLPLTPFHTGLESVLVQIAGPALWTLRAPAVLYGLLAVGLTYALGARMFGRPTALIASAALACLPMAILHSRMGYECDTTPVFGMILIYAAWRGDRTWLVLGLTGAYLSHPTNLFLVPMVVLLGLAHAWERRKIDPAWRRRWVVGSLGLLALTFGLGLSVLNRPQVQSLARQYDAGLGGRHELRRFLVHLDRALIGMDVYGTPIGRGHDRAFWFVVGPLLALGTAILWRGRQWTRLAVVVGTAIGTLGFFAVGGSESIRFGMARYAFFLALPVALSVGCLAAAIGEAVRKVRRPGVVALAALGLALLATTYVQLFRPFEAERGSTWALRSARKDARTAALELIGKDVRALGATPERVTIVAQNFWTWYPLAFLAATNRKIEVVPYHDLSGAPPQPETLKSQLRDGAYLVGKPDEEMEALFRELFPEGNLRRWIVERRVGATVVVLRLERPAEVAARQGAAPADSTTILR